MRQPRRILPYALLTAMTVLGVVAALIAVSSSPASTPDGHLSVTVAARCLGGTRELSSSPRFHTTVQISQVPRGSATYGAGGQSAPRPVAAHSQAARAGHTVTFDVPPGLYSIWILVGQTVDGSQHVTSRYIPTTATEAVSAGQARHDVAHWSC